MIQLQINLPFDIDFLILKYLDEYSIHNFLEYKKKEKYSRYIQLVTSINNIINKNFECLKIIEEIYLNIQKINKRSLYSEYKYKIYNTYCLINLNYEINYYINEQLIKFYSECNFDSEKQKKKFQNLTKYVNKKLLIFEYKIRYEPSIKTTNLKIKLSTYLDIKSNLLK